MLALRHAQHLEHLYLGVDSGEDFSFRNFQAFTLLGGAEHRTGENEAGGQYQEREARDIGMPELSADGLRRTV